MRLITQARNIGVPICTTVFISESSKYKTTPLNNRLLENERFVNIYYLILKKPKERDVADGMKLSIDELMYRMAEEKHGISEDFYDTLEKTSLESKECKA